MAWVVCKTSHKQLVGAYQIQEVIGIGIGGARLGRWQHRLD